MTGEARCPQSALPGRAVANPLFRIILRILGATIWAKKELSRLTRRELACLRCMLFQVPVTMNLGYEWLQHVLDYRGRNEELWVGGMITRIARALEVDLSLYTACPPQLMDTAYFLSSSVLKKRGNVYAATYRDSELILTEERVELLYLPNWYETWSPVPYPLAARPDGDPTLRRRPSRFPRDEAVHAPQPTDEPIYHPEHIVTEDHGIGNDAYMHQAPFGTEGQGVGNDPYSEETPTCRVHYPGDASSSSEVPSPWVEDLIQRMDEHRWRTNESRWETSDERWQSTAEFMTEMERHFPPHGRQ